MIYIVLRKCPSCQDVVRADITTRELWLGLEAPTIPAFGGVDIKMTQRGIGLDNMCDKCKQKQIFRLEDDYMNPMKNSSRFRIKDGKLYVVTDLTIHRKGYGYKLIPANKAETKEYSKEQKLKTKKQKENK